MKKIVYFGKEYTVRFDTDATPTKKRQKRGITCTLTTSLNETIVGRAECSIKDSFVRETGEALSLQRALDAISDKMVREQKQLAFSALRGPKAEKKSVKTSK